VLEPKNHRNLGIEGFYTKIMPAFKRKAEATAELVDKRSKQKQESKPNPSVLRAEEPAFPRGGASVLTPLEHKQIHIQARQDVLFEETTGRKAKAIDSEDEENEGDELDENNHVKANDRKARHSSAAQGKRKKTAQSLDGPKLKIEGLSYKVRDVSLSLSFMTLITE
jgi:rRNA biogenesis protein RRP5